MQNTPSGCQNGVVPSLDHESPTVCSVPQSCPTLCDPMDCSPPGSSVHRDSPGKNIGVGCHTLLQGIFPIQGLNSGLPRGRQILYPLSHQRGQLVLSLVLPVGDEVSGGCLSLREKREQTQLLSYTHDFKRNP